MQVDGCVELVAGTTEFAAFSSGRKRKLKTFKRYIGEAGECSNHAMQRSEQDRIDDCVRSQNILARASTRRSILTEVCILVHRLDS